MNTQRVEGHTPRTMGELVMQHAKRDTMSTDEGCRMLELPDAAENFCAANTYLSALSTIRRLEKVNEALVRALREIASCPEEDINEQTVHIMLSIARSALAKEPA